MSLSNSKERGLIEAIGDSMALHVHLGAAIEIDLFSILKRKFDYENVMFGFNILKERISTFWSNWNFGFEFLK